MLSKRTRSRKNKSSGRKRQRKTDTNKSATNENENEISIDRNFEIGSEEESSQPLAKSSTEFLDRDIEDLVSLGGSDDSNDILASVQPSSSLNIQVISPHSSISNKVPSSILSATHFKKNKAARELLFYYKKQKAQISQDKYLHIIDVEKYSTNRTPARETKYWIKSFGLTLDNKNILQCTRWLDDRIIDASQRVLANQFKDKLRDSSFNSVINSLSLHFTIESGIFIQILHNGYQQWLVVGTHHPEVLVSDSLYQTVSEYIKHQISSLLSTNEKEIRLKFVNVVKQLGGDDCGVFSVAYATDLYFGKRPGEFFFNQTRMRNHLMNCLENQHFKMFPIIKERRETGNKINVEINISMYCNCRMPAKKPMVKCGACHESFHVGACVNVASKAMQDKQCPWNCSGCTSKEA